MSSKLLLVGGTKKRLLHNRVALTFAPRHQHQQQRQQHVMRSLLCGAGRSFSSSTTYPDKWAAAAEKELKGKKPLDSLLFHTPEGVTIKPVYGAHDVAEQQIDQGMYIYVDACHVVCPIL